MGETIARPAARTKFACGGHTLDNVVDGEKPRFVSLPAIPGQMKEKTF